MPGFGFPPGVAGGGGGGGGGTSNVTGGSGATYPTLTAALLGETQTVVTDTTQAGTVAGSITGSAGLSATDNFYKDFWIVLTDATPGNGLVCRYARVSAYVGATKVLTIDQPWNFGVGETYQIISPVRLWVSADLTENVTINKSVELDLGGHRLVGTVDITASMFTWIRGADGYVTNGIQKTDIGALRLDDLTVSRRDGTIYALLMTNGSDLGRTVLYNCQFSGVVAGRRGFAGWEITNCRNNGVAETNRNVPYRLCESITGVAIVAVNTDVFINSEFAGAIFYSENTITGTPVIWIDANIVISKETTPQADVTQQPCNFFITWAVGAGVMTMTTAANSNANIVLVGGSVPATSTLISAEALAGVAVFTDFTGTSTLTFTTFTIRMTVTGAVSSLRVGNIYVNGTATCTGAITRTGGALAISGSATFSNVGVNAPLNATITHSGTVIAQYCTAVAGISFGASQTAGAPVVTTSGSMSCQWPSSAPGLFTISLSGVTVSLGTYTISGSLDFVSGASSTIALLSSGVSGGTWLVSGTIRCSSPQASNGSMTIASSSATGGTLTISNTVDVSGTMCGNITVITCTGAGGTVIVSGAVRIAGFHVITGPTVLVTATTATSTATFSGTLTMVDCFFMAAAFTMFNATAAGGVAQAPATVTFSACHFSSTFTDRTGGGTLTLAAATWKFFDCTFQGLVTLLGTPFTELEFTETAFMGNSANNSITITGTRPTTYRLWKCTYVANVGLLLSEIIHEYEVRPAAAALGAGNLLIIDAAGAAAAQTAGGRNHGVALAAAGGAAEAVVMVRRGVVFVDAEAATVAGSSCVVDAGGTPTRMIPGASVVGQTIGTALEPDGTTRAGESYTVVDLC